MVGDAQVMHAYADVARGHLLEEAVA
jgi:hypothetical protein